jgi:NAD(P)H-flavin reductase
MLAKKYKSKITSINNHFNGIYTLEFKSLGRPYKYLPGQFIHLALDEDYDGIGQWPESRCFSIQTNPNEEAFKITYAVKGAFTKEMETTLEVGSEVWLKLPYGNLFQQPHNKQNTVFIAGGTGITPFLSLFTHESFNEYIRPKIYFGFRSKEFNIYQSELNSVKHCVPKIFYQDTQGVIDIHNIFVKNGIYSYYFISGPPSMIKIFKTSLIEKGVPASNILTDDWD